ncbi:hypothetical protein BKA70DRAFT_1479682 [Coprinopsis sp. MPI-PUGE-AT-0042]|nr:hypothetical protein BKA70DRAFT_1479682 [Coprinopsis sp. MPI-PUGE-AT-0042]
MPVTLDPQFDPYTLNNEPLPEALKPPLVSMLDALDHELILYKEQLQKLDFGIFQNMSMIQTLQEDIERTKIARSKSLRSHSALRAQRSKYAATLSAVRRVPPEVIAIIMGFAIRGVDPWGSVGRWERKTFLFIRSVCKVWRNTALFTTSLWRDLQLEHCDIPVWHSNPQSMESFQRSLTSWHSRGGHNARLTMHLPGVSFNDALALLSAVGTSKLNVASIYFTCDRLGRVFGGFPDLKALEHPLPTPLRTKDIMIHTKQSQSQVLQETTINLEINFPSLMTLSIGVVVPQGPSAATFSYTLIHTSLSFLVLYNVNLVPANAEILQGLPRLRMLRLQKCFSAGNRDAGPLPPFIHGSLESIELFGTFPEAFLCRLVCPSLTQVYIDGEQTGSTDPPEEVGRILGDFLERCGSPVHLGCCRSHHRLLQCPLQSPAPIHHLSIDAFSSLTLQSSLTADSNDAPPIALPPALESITCHQQGTIEELRKWMDMFPVSEKKIRLEVPFYRPAIYYL